MEEATFKHAQKVSQTLESELSRFERVLSAFEKHLEQQAQELSSQVSDKHREIDIFVSDFKKEVEKEIT